MEREPVTGLELSGAQVDEKDVDADGDTAVDTIVVSVRREDGTVIKKETGMTVQPGESVAGTASGAKGYQLQYAADKKFKKKKSRLTKKKKYTVKKLKKKKTYYFRVRAYKLDGKKKVYGKWSKVKKLKIKK